MIVVMKPAMIMDPVSIKSKVPSAFVTLDGLVTNVRRQLFIALQTHVHMVVALNQMMDSLVLVTQDTMEQPVV